MTDRGNFDSKWEIRATALPRFDGRSTWWRPDRRFGEAVREAREAEGDRRHVLAGVEEVLP